MTFPIHTDYAQLPRDTRRSIELLHGHRKACPVCGTVSLDRIAEFCTVGQMLTDDILHPILVLPAGPVNRWWRFCRWLGRGLARIV